jgi:pyruvate,orthophosphate dikinase
VATLAGRTVTVDGSSGVVHDGKLPVVVPDEENDPVLQRLCQLAEAQAPITIHSDHCGAAVPVDADFSSVADLDSLRRALAALPQGATVRGPLFAQVNEAVEAAVEAGVARIVTRPRLPALLASIRYASSKAPVQIKPQPLCSISTFVNHHPKSHTAS